MMLTGCAGLADYSYDLPGDYSIVRTSAHQVTIAPKISESNWGSDIIPKKVTEVAWDDNYILVKQLGLMIDPSSRNGYQIPNNDDIYFWIIEFKTREVLGPLDDEGFIRMKHELGILDNVILKNVEDLK
ncbi:DUF3997 domain-containing protein [Evansella clarkii]|uniref:DUF3997 domain-containing protein n=1 Tax=Evansella clarkii TaxID=79879 RepID=UPI001ADC986F|nr:DUF3997 domain-containing protein [Evansella clarkii]